MPEQKRRSRTLLWSIVGVLAMLAVILLLGMLDDPSGAPILDSPGGAFSQTIATAGLVLAAALPVLRRTQKDTAETKEHVVNSHVDEAGNPIILRDDIDAIHGIVTELAADMKRGFSGVSRDIGRLADADQQTHGDVQQLRKEFSAHVDWSQKQAQKLDDLEDTIPKPPSKE